MIEKRMEQRGQGGFTLIELLVVIAILAVLGGAVIIGIGAMRENAEEQVCKTNKETIELAIEAYKVSEDANPADLEALTGAGYLKAGTVDVDDWEINGAAGTARYLGGEGLDENCDD